MKWILLSLTLLVIAPGCASTGTVQTKHTVTVDVLQPTHDALAAFQDLEINLFRGGTLPMLTPQAHVQIEAKLEIAFRSHAAATRAVRTWVPGQPVPIDVTQIQADVSSIGSLLNTLGVPPASPLAAGAQRALNAATALVGQFQGAK